jgi:glycosyltransferase involved in cell wall biosynthesis
MFFTDGLSKLGSSPTRMGEALASGIPVISNRGVGDTAEIICENRVGVLATGDRFADMEKTFREFQRLQADVELIDRCRGTAEAIFSLEGGTGAYRILYDEITSATVLEKRRTSS